MPTTRRKFIKQSIGAVSVSMLLPGRLFATRPAEVDPNRRILVLIELNGGNDGLNTIIPHSDANYHRLRPTLGFHGEELKDESGNSTLINEQFGFHPAMKECKALYDAGKLAVVLGVGYPNPTLSHFTSMHIWQSGRLSNSGLGWIGRYADQTLRGKSPLSAVAVGNTLPLTVAADSVNIPRIRSSGDSQFVVSSFGDPKNIINLFRKTNTRTFPSGSFTEKIAEVGLVAEQGGNLIQSLLATYTSTQTYPTSPIATALKLVAVMASASPESNIFHIGYQGFFDNHAQQSGTAADGFRNKLIGIHPTELRRLSEALKVFHDDMTDHGLADNLLTMTYSEFGRRPNENGSHGTDHGTASNLFVIGNKVKGGLYGMQPSLASTALDLVGNMRFTTDFRSVYATVLSQWLPGGDVEKVLGGQFAPLGFL